MFLLNTYYMPIAIIDTGDIAVIKTTKDFVFMGAWGLDLEMAVL